MTPSRPPAADADDRNNFDRTCVVSSNGAWLRDEFEAAGVRILHADEAIAAVGAGEVDVVVLGSGLDHTHLLARLREESDDVAVLVWAATESERIAVRRVPSAPIDTTVLTTGATPTQVLDAIADGAERCRLRVSLHSTLDEIDLRSGYGSDRALRRGGRIDTLTGLLDRASVLDALVRGRSRERRAVLFVDVDHLKTINDRHGHSIGDHVLRAVAERLRHAVRPGDIVGRLGGDEFVVAVDLAPGGRTAEQIADRIVAGFEEPVHIGNWNLKVTVSVGVATADPDSDATLVLANADAAMYRSKRGGRATYQIHDELAERDRRRRQHLIASLPRAVRGRQIRSVLDPVLDLKTRSIVGYRAEPIWIDHTQGEVRRGELSVLADAAGIADDVELAFWESAVQAFRLRALSTPAFRPMLWLPARDQALREGPLRDLRQVVDHTLLHSSQIVLEIPATSAARETAGEIAGVEALCVGIGDVGAGPIDLTAIAEADVQFAALAAGLLEHQPGQRGIAAITAALQALGIACVATGATDPEDVVTIAEAGVRYCSGPALSTSSVLVEEHEHH